MRALKAAFGVTTVVAALLMFLPAHASADTYSVSALSAANNIGVYGIDGAGDVVLRAVDLSPGACGPTTQCYFTYFATGAVSVSASIPTLAYDNGTPCSPAVPAGATVFDAACNQGHEAFSALIPTSPMGGVQGIFDGQNPVTDLVRGGTANQLVLNANGDFAYTDGSTEMIYKATDLTTAVATTPEPASLALLGTGALGAVGVLRRKMRERW